MLVSGISQRERRTFDEKRKERKEAEKR